MTTFTNKGLLRQALRFQRQQISVEQQEKKALAAAQQLSALPNFTQAKHIAGYWPVDSEMSPLPIFETAFAQQQQCYLPLIQGESKTLQFVEYKPNDALIPNRYGILEPDPNERSFFPLEELDLILVPLVGFDENGHRLGMGQGYYDQTLQDLHNKKPVIVGLAFEIQRIETLPKDEWDVALHGILTEKRYLTFT